MQMIDGEAGMAEMQREPPFDTRSPTTAFFNRPTYSPEWLGSSFAAHGMHMLLNTLGGKKTLKFGETLHAQVDLG